ncbi:MAG: hypothetical protein LCH37_00200 [Bacteroidetes bacterium]|nr:hypothetical protein [Bacteroidota bacterium]
MNKLNPDYPLDPDLLPCKNNPFAQLLYSKMPVKLGVNTIHLPYNNFVFCYAGEKPISFAFCPSRQSSNA